MSAVTERAARLAIHEIATLAGLEDLAAEYDDGSERKAVTGGAP